MSRKLTRVEVRSRGRASAEAIESEPERAAARRFWAELHPFYRPLLAEHLALGTADRDGFPWKEWFFAKPEWWGAFMAELRQLVARAEREGEVEPACDEQGVLLPSLVVVPDAAPDDVSDEADEHALPAQTTLW